MPADQEADCGRRYIPPSCKSPGEEFRQIHRHSYAWLGVLLHPLEDALGLQGSNMSWQQRPDVFAPRRAGKMFNFSEQVTRSQVTKRACVLCAGLEGARYDQVHVIAGFSPARNELAGLTGNYAGQLHDLTNAVFPDAIEQLWHGTFDELDPTFDPEVIICEDLARLKQVYDRFKRNRPVATACLISARWFKARA